MGCAEGRSDPQGRAFGISSYSIFRETQREGLEAVGVETGGARADRR